MTKRTAYLLLGAVFAFVVWGLFFTAKADEMELKVTNGKETQTFNIPTEGKLCVIHGQLIAIEFMVAKSLRGWYIVRLSCGSPRRNL